MVQYEIHIGEFFNMDTKQLESKQIIIINQEQLDVIQIFANIERTKDLEEIYVLNKVKFTIQPHFVPYN